jgi:ketosteroid isomerase-like protein
MGESDEHKELLKAMNKWVTSINDKDIDAAYEIWKESIGFGWRNPNFRDRSQTTEDKFKRGMGNLYASITDFHGSYENKGVRIIGDTGLLGGIYTEKITGLDGSVRVVKVRHSSTWMKLDGEWKLVMFHRDTQFNNP